MISLFALNGLFRSFLASLRAEGGQTMAEYGLLLAVIAVVVVLAAIFLGTQISSIFSSVGSTI